ncbi:MAG: hypothetical protein IJP45_03600 [Paludibacteraceae bacterium]|nr:hypothetical protein [Paludibacteraceae bacterium]
MRNLNKEEQYIVRKLVSAREKLQIQEMCLATILDESLDSMAIEWSANQVSVFAKKSINAQEQYMHLCDIIALFLYLEMEGMILVHTNPDLLQEKALYNHNMYKKEGDKYVSLDESGLSVEIFGKPNVFNYSVPSQHSTTIYSNLSTLLDKYICALIHPTQELVDYVNNGFKTKEDLQFRCTKNLAIVGIIVAILIGIAGIWVNMYKC